MSKNFKVSVILPVYNGEKTIQKTLDSLKNQTYKDFELVCCIDGSNDASIEIIESNRADFQSLSILKNDKNLGLGSTMNRLVSNTLGEYIAIAEQDDFYYKDRLKLQVDVLNNKHDVGLVSGIADFWNGDKITFRFPGLLVNNEQYPKGEAFFLLNYKYQIKVANSCVMFRKSVHIDHGLYFSKHYPNVSVDWSYILRFCLVSDVYGINRSLVLLDRSIDRNSVTSNKLKQYTAARELIRSFYYEYPTLISKRDYKFALTTQYLMELSNFNKFKMIVYFIYFFIQNPSDGRFLKFLNKKFNKKK